MSRWMLSLLLFINWCWAAPTSSAPALTWAQAVELLKENNPEYKAAEWTFKSTQALELGARSGYYPSISGSLNYSQSRSEVPGDIYSTGTTAGQSYSASLNLSQNLFAGWRDTYKTQQASANTRVASSTFQTAKAKISNDFVTAYQSLLTAYENLKLSESIEFRRKEDLRMVQLRFESGRENKGSVMLSQAYLEQARYETLQAGHAIELAQTNLSQVLGLPTKNSVQVSESVPQKNPEEHPDFEGLATQTPEHQQILATIDANMAAVGLARTGFLPTLNLTGSVGETGPDFYPQQRDRWTIGASLTIPLFDGFKDVSAVRSSTDTKNSSEQHRSTVDETAVTNLKQAYQKYVEAIEKLKVDESFQKAAQVRAEVARSQYSNGLITFTDWDQIENDLINRQKTYVISKRDRVLSEAAWDQIRGQGVLP